MPTLDRVARYLLLGLIWVGAVVLSLAMILNEGASIGIFPLVIMACAFCAAIAANYILLNPTAGALPTEAKSESAAKRKNEQAGFSPFELLTPEDLEELRAEMKDRLRERMLSDTDGEMASLDDLLDELPARAKRQ